MKYTIEITNRMVADYKSGKSVEEIATELSAELNEEVRPRSIIAKLSSLGVYQRKTYLNKRGELPVKKEEYIQRIAESLNINVDLLESMEKVTKTALVLLDKQVRELGSRTQELKRD